MGLKIIGAGLGRTGTMSLKIALEGLGFGPCYHMIECIPQGPDHWQLWVDALSGRQNWESVFTGFNSAVDFPTCSSYLSLAQYYPDAKIILTVRDQERWFDSTQETIFSPKWIEFLRASPMNPFLQLTVFDFFKDRLHDKNHFIERFQDHVNEVKKNIPASRLLVFDVRQGWAPLCEFLNVPEPDTEFPRVNEAEETKNLLNDMMQGKN